MTHTYAILPVSQTAFDEIRQRIETAGYQAPVETDEGPVIDMYGLALRPDADVQQRTVIINYVPSPQSRSRFVEITESLIPEIEAAFQAIGVQTQWQELPSPWGALAEWDEAAALLRELHGVIGLAYEPGQSVLPGLQRAAQALARAQDEEAEPWRGLAPVRETADHLGISWSLSYEQSSRQWWAGGWNGRETFTTATGAFAQTLEALLVWMRVTRTPAEGGA